MRLSKTAFDTTINKLKITKNSKSYKYAEGYLVDGFTAESLAKTYNVSRQAIHQAAKKVYSAYLQNCPPGWVIITLQLPSNLADELKRQEEILIAEYLQETKEGKNINLTLITKT